MAKKREIRMKLKPTPKQDESYSKLFDHETNEICFGSAGGTGKTFHGVEWETYMALCYPGTRWGLCRSQLKELRSTTVITLYKCLKHHGITPEDIFTYNQVDGYFKFHNGSRIDLLALNYEPSDPLYSRFGSLELTGAFVDEAAGIEGEAINVLRSRIGRCENEKYNLFPKLLICSNPTKGYLYYTFYLPWKEGTLPKNRAFIKALPSDNTYLDKNSLVSMNTLTGSMRERILFGKWEFEADNQGIIEYQAIIDAFSGPVSAKVKRTGQMYLCIDPARYGADSSALTVWDGLRLEHIFLYHKLSIPELAEKVNELRERFSIPISHVACDSIGLGAGLFDLLPGAKQFVANARPIEQTGKKEMHANLLTQASFRLAELMNERMIYINCPEENYDLRDRIIKELESLRVKDQLTDGVLNIIPKKEVKEEIGHSPDIRDSILQRMLFELQPHVGPPLLFQNFNRGEIQKQFEQKQNTSRMPEYGFTIGNVERTDGKRDLFTF